MTRSLKWQIALALVFVFLAGVATGVFGTVHHIRFMMFEHHSGRIRERMTEHLQRELRLTPQQLEQVHPIIERCADRLDAIRVETSRRVADTMKQSHDEIAPQLTAEQKTKLDRMEQHHRRMLHMHGPPPPPDAP